MAAGALQILQKSLESARMDLSSTNDAIKRLTGRDPNEKPVPRFSNQERRTSNSGRDTERRTSTSGRDAERRVSGSGRDTERRITSPIKVERRFSGHGREGERRITGPTSERRGKDGGRMRAWTSGRDGPSAKRRDITGSRSRLAGRLGPEPGMGGAAPLRREETRERGLRHRNGSVSTQGEDKHGHSDAEDNEEKASVKPSLQSSVVATKVPPRPNADPKEDEKSKKRNRRMFGFLMGTLQKFKESEDVAKQSEKERRRAEIEEKLEQKRELEKEEAMQAKSDLFEERKTKKSKIARLSSQLFTIHMYEEWNAHDRLLLGYIKTKTTPPIFYLPAEHTPKTEKLFRETQSAIEGKISERQREIESFIAENGEDSVKMEDSFTGVVKVDNEEFGEMDVEDKGRGRRAESDSGDGSDKEP